MLKRKTFLKKNKNLNTTTARNRRLHHLKRHKKRTFQRHA